MLIRAPETTQDGLGPHERDEEHDDHRPGEPQTFTPHGRIIAGLPGTRKALGAPFVPRTGSRDHDFARRLIMTLCLRLQRHILAGYDASADQLPAWMRAQERVLSRPALLPESELATFKAADGA